MTNNYNRTEKGSRFSAAFAKENDAYARNRAYYQTRSVTKNEAELNLRLRSLNLILRSKKLCGDAAVGDAARRLSYAMKPYKGVVLKPQTEKIGMVKDLVNIFETEYAQEMATVGVTDLVADLKQALLYFAKEMFSTDTKIRLRPSYFPFTEPSAEMDISCNICGGKGCPFCKGTGWVEILGCGMVDPNVLENCGIDSKIYSGYALGMGIERITNLKYQIKDLRMFSENDIRFLRQFESAN